MPYWKQHKQFWFILAPLLLLSYSNSFTAGWHFDDIPNIVLNSNIHLTSFSQDSFLNTFFLLEESPVKLHRPVAYFTLGLNWLAGQDNVLGYHLVNFVFHLLTCLCLYNTILLLYRTPALRKQTKEEAIQVSFFATLLWALQPMHTQTVTYIVQRMCGMVALFSVLGMLCYIAHRLSKTLISKIIFLVALAFCFLLALGSKENAILLPANLLLIELIFFYTPNSWRKYNTAIFATGILSIIGLFIFLTLTDYWQHISILSGYHARFFSIQERLLTEPRIIFFYLSQLFYPIPQQLSLAHDIDLSHSLIDPISTLLAILLIVILLTIAVKQIPKWPIFSFAILFFFLNHLVESTIIPLELIFEHRNYLPSLFLFWPLSILACTTIPSLFTSRWLDPFIWKPAMLLLILLLGASTFSRNSVWQTDSSLWQDAHSKAPNRARPVYYLGVKAENSGNFKEALDYYQNALLLTAPSPVRFRALTHIRIAELQASLSNYERALNGYRKAKELKPDSSLPKYKLAEIHLAIGNLEQAEVYLRKIIQEHKDGEKTHALLGKILLQSGKNKEALSELAASLQVKQIPDTAVDFAIALAGNGLYQEAKQVIGQFAIYDKSTALPIELLRLVMQAATEESLSEKQVNRILTDYPLTSINNNLERFTLSGISPDYIQPVNLLLASGMENKINTLFTTTKNGQ